jgi:hypothetical protein
MIKGAAIFGAGVFVGYNMALRDPELKEATLDLIKTTKNGVNVIVDTHLDNKTRANDQESDPRVLAARLREQARVLEEQADLAEKDETPEPEAPETV